MENNILPLSDYRRTPVAYLALVKDLYGREGVLTTPSGPIEIASVASSPPGLLLTMNPLGTIRDASSAEQSSLRTGAISMETVAATGEVKISIQMDDVLVTEGVPSSEPHPRGPNT